MMNCSGPDIFELRYFRIVVAVESLDLVSLAHEVPMTFHWLGQNELAHTMQLHATHSPCDQHTVLDLYRVWIGIGDDIVHR